MKNTTSSGTDKVSLSHHDILSLENEKATLLICIGLFLHHFFSSFFFFVKNKHTKKCSTSHLWLHVGKKKPSTSWHGNNITITLICSQYYLTYKARHLPPKWAAHWATRSRADVRKMWNENFYTVLTKNPRTQLWKWRQSTFVWLATFKNLLHNYCWRQKSLSIVFKSVPPC